MYQCFCGIDIGKAHHWAAVVDSDGRQLLSHKLTNSETDLRRLIDEVQALGATALWAVDMAWGPAALTLAALEAAEAEVVYVPGLAVKASRSAWRGESKSDRSDAVLIAENARLRHGLRALGRDGRRAELAALLAHRGDLVAERTRTANRLRSTLMAISPALERATDPRRQGSLLLLSRYCTPTQIRRMGAARLAAWLAARRVCRSTALAERACAAARSQSLVLPAEATNARLVMRLATRLLALRSEIDGLEAEIGGAFAGLPQAAVVSSLPGIGALTGAQVLASIGDIGAFDSADKLAAYAGLAPVACDSGKRQGVRRRARGGNKLLKQALYQAAFCSLGDPASRAYYERKRREGKQHHQALLALARRRTSVLYAMLRDGTLYRRPALT